MSQENDATAESRGNGSGDKQGLDGTVGSDGPQIKAQLEAAQVQANENHEKFLRVAADMENTRRRAQIDVANAHKYAVERFANELLPVRDSLEFARTVDIRLESETALQKMHEGLDLTLKLMDDVFRKFGVAPIDPKGEKFNPAKHHAISMVESHEIPPNHVVNVMQKGYTLQDRVLRPAMVVVSKAAAPAAEPPPPLETG
jgi:molecular chaperone GrpE